MTTMTLLNTHMKEAMRAKQAERLGALRFLISNLKNKQIELRRELTQEEIVSALSTEVKKRREAAAAYREGGRLELAEKEEFELALIQEYLPKQLEEEEVIAMIVAAIEETGATTKRDMGRVMGRVISQTKGRFDGSKIKNLVLARLD